MIYIIQIYLDIQTKKSYAKSRKSHDTPGQVEGVPISWTGENETKTELVPEEKSARCQCHLADAPPQEPILFLFHLWG